MEQYDLVRKRFLDEEAPRVESEYMITTPTRFTGKTWVYEVDSKRGMMGLGEVKWFGRWRQYAFFPYSETTFSRGCLNDISTFIDALMEERVQSSASKAREK